MRKDGGDAKKKKKKEQLLHFSARFNIRFSERINFKNI